MSKKVKIKSARKFITVAVVTSTACIVAVLLLPDFIQRTLSKEIRSVFHVGSKLMTMNLRTNPADFDSITVKANRKLNASAWFSEDLKYQKMTYTGRLNYGGQSYEVNYRLRGDTPLNFAFGVEYAPFKIQSDEPFEQLETGAITLIHPVHEFGVYGLSFYGFCASMNLYSKPLIPIRFSINDTPDHLYFLQADLSGVEPSQKGWIVRYDDDCNYKYDQYAINSELDIINGKTARKLDIYKDLWPQFLNQYYGFERNTDDLAEIFDIEKFAYFAVILDAFQAHHSSLCLNARFYFNTESKKLEPVAWDPGNHFFDALEFDPDEIITSSSELSHNYPVLRELFADSVFVNQYVHLIESRKIEQELGHYLEQNAESFEDLDLMIHKDIHNNSFDADKILSCLHVIANELTDQSTILKAVSRTENTIWLQHNGYLPIRIKPGNQMVFPGQVFHINFGNDCQDGFELEYRYPGTKIVRYFTYG